MRFRVLLSSVVFTLLAASAQVVAGAQTLGSAIAVPQAGSPPPIDGTLSAAAWKSAVKVTLPYDVTTHTPSKEPTTVYLLADRSALYVAFDAQQPRTPVVANQHTNNVGMDLDDEAVVSLWPNGSQGFAYVFAATAAGTRYQSSSENLSYEPQWAAAGRLHGNGYLVTMRIPFAIMHGASKDHWLVQLSRFEPTTGALYVYNGGPNLANNSDVTYARPLTGLPQLATRPQPRFAPYTLGTIASPVVGGNTSRVGLDLSIPITNKTAFVATLHPDFSNVEADQQTIAPSAFRRSYTETRPFFAQGAKFYNYYECDACPNSGTLYTPGIPTPTYGYAIEGKQGPFSFAGFSSVVAGARTDSAQVLNYRTIPNNLFYTVQRVSVSMPGLRDDTMQYSAKWSDLQHKFIYANYAQENGTAVTDPAKARWLQAGGAFFTSQTFSGFSFTKLGSQYSPYDGFVSYNDIGGYGFYSNRHWRPRGGSIKEVYAEAMIDRYHGAHGPNYADTQLSADVTTRNLWKAQFQTGSSYGLDATGTYVIPLTQNQAGVTYHSGTSTPTSVQYATGRYGAGRLDSWYRSTTIRIARGMYLNLEADDTRQYVKNGTNNVQWLERASIAFQSGSESSFAIGWRKFVGTPPNPNGGGMCLAVCTNLSFAYRKRFDHRELYVAYGNPSKLNSLPQFLVKLIDYIGADKGT